MPVRPVLRISSVPRRFFCLHNWTSRSVSLTPAGELSRTRAAALLEDATGLVAPMREPYVPGLPRDAHAELPLIECYETNHGFFHTNARRIGDYVRVSIQRARCRTLVDRSLRRLHRRATVDARAALSRRPRPFPSCMQR